MVGWLVGGGNDIRGPSLSNSVMISPVSRSSTDPFFIQSCPE